MPTAPTTTTADQPRARRGRGRGRPALPASPPMVLAALLVLAAFAAAAWWRRWTVDDAFIVFRVVDHVLSGNGVVFNAGERVEAVTSPLWLAMLVVLRALVPVPVEWLAVVVGLALAVGGLACALAGSRLLAPATGGRLLPAGALLWLGLPPAWDFATSGLESGLGTMWLGACCWGLAWLAVRPVERAAGDLRAPEDGPGVAPRAAVRAPAGTPVLVALSVLAGLGPVIRPDFGLFSVVFVVALLALAGRRPRVWLSLLAAAIAVPMVVQIARMGYYAALLPNTLLAKEAGGSNWRQGGWYLADFLAPYALAVPLAALTWLHARAALDDDRRRRLARLAPALAGVLYAVAVVRGGGDFMHARLLLPALFVLLAPVAFVRVRSRLDATAIVVLGLWALVSAVSLRAPEIEGPGRGISDQRAFYVSRAGVPNPVMLDDYRGYARVTRGARAAALAAAGRRALIVDEQVHRLAPAVAPTVVYEAGAVGLPGSAAGHDVYVLDRLGLGDAYAARQRIDERIRPGHDKPLPMAWVWGRYGVLGDVPEEQVDAARAARAAHACAPLRELRQAIAAPLTVRRFLANIAAAPRLTVLRYPSDPHAAVAELCGERS